MSLFPRTVETDRLRLTPLGEEPSLALYEHCRPGAPNIDAITEYLTWDPHETPKETRDFLETVAQRREAGEEATYAVRPRESEGESESEEDGNAENEADRGEFAGATSLSVDWERERATLGIWLRKPFWGRGYSGERAAALIAVAFERLDLGVVGVTCHVDNDQSRRAIEKYVQAHGGHEEGLIRNGEAYPDGPVDVFQYSVTAAEYRDATD